MFISSIICFAAGWDMFVHRYTPPALKVVGVAVMGVSGALLTYSFIYAWKMAVA
jgi:hypothetical protein